MKPIIRVEGLGKRYRIGKSEPYHTLRESLARLASKPFRFPRSRFRSATDDGAHDADHIWALRDVSFEVLPGEVVGIIGRNGAGKSTLLKVLSRITKPTAGKVELYGRVGSLLEVGTGFHAELTGRENICLNGSILGMTRGEIIRKFDEIVAFAGVEKFLDTPVKRYSSGMYIRLAFAVAAHLETEILMVDEVLSVGDAAFQQKCLGKMNDIAKHGRTVILVSHDMRAIRHLCESVLYIRDGRAIARGATDEMVARYAADNVTTDCVFPAHNTDVTIHSFAIRQCGMAADNLDGGTCFDIEIDFELHRDLIDFRTGIYVQTSAGDNLVRTFLADWAPRREKQLAKGRYKARLDFPANLLSAGAYTIVLHASKYGGPVYFASEISRRIVVSWPESFNTNHMDEKMDNPIILERRWHLESCNALF